MKIKRGRPLLGNIKRERASFTLSPVQIAWLNSEAKLTGESKSKLLENIIERAILENGPEKSNVLNFPRIIIPELKIKNFCKKNNIKTLYLFGSVLRNDFSSKSDIDVLVEFLPEKTPSYLQIVPMEEELSKIFGGRKIDLKTFYELSKYFRDHVKEEANLLYAA